MAILPKAVSTWASVLYYVIFLRSVTYGLTPEDTQPHQLRLSFGDSTRDIVIMAATRVNCSASVKYGNSYFHLTTEVTGRGALFDQSKMNPNGLHYLHRIVLKNLEPGREYFYAVQCNDSESRTYGFKVPRNDTNWSPKFLVYGDMGLESPIVPRLQKEIQSGKNYTAVLHLGDIAYQLESEGGGRGDKFMDMIEPIASRVPYLTTPGNHEVARDTFVRYRYRFSTPTTDWPIPLEHMWYSLDVGPVHLISYNTEVFNMTDKKYIALQRDWLVNDLQKAKENRETVPWIVAFAYQPFYCSNSNGRDCTRENSVVRKNLEEVFFQFSVDLILNAQQHSYERLWPTYKGTVHAQNYTDPTAPVSIISGTAGGSLVVDPMDTQPGVWTAFRSGNDSMNSYGVLSVVNNTHLYWKQVSGVDGTELDSILISQDRHGDFVTVSPDEASDTKDWTKDGSHPDVQETDNTFSQQATKVVQHVKEIIKSNKPVAIGVASTVSVLLLIGCVCVIVRCRRRKSSPRRWEKLDYDKSFYSDVKTAEDDFSCDESEIQLDGNGTMPTSKLLSKKSSQQSFSHYRYRFSPPSTEWPVPLNKMWYSIDIGPVHLVSYNTEVYNMSDTKYVGLQRDWLVQDLTKANKNRARTPWIVAIGHKPLYCSTIYEHDCNADVFDVRNSLEEVFSKYSVDLLLNGHVHSYERLWPTYKGKVTSMNYSNPSAPVTVISGAAGSGFGMDPMIGAAGPWTAFRMTNKTVTFKGYGVLTVANSTHLHWKQVAYIDNHVIDSFWLAQNNHGNSHVTPEPSSTWNAADYINHVKDVIKSNKGIAIGLTSALCAFLLLGCVCIFLRCRRRRGVTRRWEVVDYDKSFYSDVRTEDDDFAFDDPDPNLEANGTTPTAKLLGKAST